MAKENPMPPLYLHVVGLAFTGSLVWCCYWLWQVMPTYTGPTLLNPLRIVVAMLAMFVVLSFAHLLTKLFRRVVTGGK
ncbi:MAG: hypothetical protein AAFR75_11670 [Pseudomonadota bacterium]